MKKFNKIICFLLSAICILSFASCKDKETTQQTSKNPIAMDTYSYNKGVHVFNVQETTDYFVQDGKTQYSIVISKDAEAYISKAAVFLTNKFKAATGITLPLVYVEDISYNANSKYIILGYYESVYQSAGVSSNVDAIRNDGIRILTKDKSVFIFSKNAKGVHFGVQEFLHQILNYEFYTPECEYIDTNVTEIKLKNFDITDYPDIPYRYNNYQLGNTENGNLGYRVSGDVIATLAGGQFHNTFLCVPKSKYQETHPDWYSTGGGQLCFTTRGDSTEYEELKSVVLEQVKIDLTKNKDAKAITLTHEDVSDWCTCEKCQEVISKYNGAKSSTIILFIKDIAAAVADWLAIEQPGREVELIFFAYGPTLQAPTVLVDGEYVPIDEAVSFSDNMGVLYAPINADYQYTFRDDVNRDIYVSLDSWSSMTDNMWVWIYATNFTDYLTPYNAISTLQDNYKILLNISKDYLLFLLFFFDSRISIVSDEKPISDKTSLTFTLWSP